MLCRAFPARRRWPSGTAVGGVRASVPLQGASWRSGSANGSRTFFFKRGPPPKLFDIEGLEAPKDFPRLASDAVRSAQQVLDGAERKGPGELVAALDTASNELCRIADAAELCRNVHPNQEFVAAASDAVGIVAGYMGEVNFDVGIYEAMLRGESGEQFEKLPLETKTVLRHMRLSMEHEGIHLPEAQKGECLQLLEREQQLSFDIVQQQEQKRGDISTGSLWLPLENLREPLAGQVDRLRKRKQGTGAEEVLLPSDPMWSEQVLRRSPCASTRRAVFEAQQALDEEGEAAMADLRDVRHNLAGMRGYQSWNAYAQRESLLSDPRRVESFLDSVWDRLRPGLLQDMKELAAPSIALLSLFVGRKSLGNGPYFEAGGLSSLMATNRCANRRLQRLSAHCTGTPGRSAPSLLSTTIRSSDSNLIGRRSVAACAADSRVNASGASHLVLRSGDQMPAVGIGLWKVGKSDCADTVYRAIKAGYRCIDEACDYGNEQECGEGIRRAIADGLVTRQQLWITSKLWNTYHRREHVRAACQRSLQDLGLDYLDLYLIHFPISLKYVPFEVRYPPEWIHDPSSEDPRMIEDGVPMRETWEAMETLVRDGLVRNIGICNVGTSMLRDILSYATIKPAVLQVELHPYNAQDKLLRFCRERGIAVIGFSNLGASSYVELGGATAQDSCLREPVVEKIAAVHQKTPAQVVLRWAVQRGTAVIPKTTSEKRLSENLDLFGFQLSPEEMSAIGGLDNGRRFNDPGVFCEAAFGCFCPIYE